MSSNAADPFLSVTKAGAFTLALQQAGKSQRPDCGGPRARDIADSRRTRARMRRARAANLIWRVCAYAVSLGVIVLGLGVLSA